MSSFFVAENKDGNFTSGYRKDFSGLSESEMTWIDVHGFDESTLLDLQKEFDLHPLTVEDCLNAHTRTKYEEFKHYTYVVIKGVLYKKNRRFGFEQINYIIGKNFLITVSLKKRKDFERLKNNQKHLKEFFHADFGLEYILHHLIDIEVDRYFPYLEQMDDEVDKFATEPVDSDKLNSIQPVFNLKREIIDVRKEVVNMRVLMRTLSSREVKFIDNEVMVYFSDVYDHLIRITDMVNTQRDLVTSTLEVQLAASSYKTNDIVRILTIITTLFMPLTFITGLYGMNFRYMPELSSSYGYPIVLFVMVLIEVSMLIYFKRKKWF